ncbi:MAG: Ig-like domain-containing protein [Syntrophomonadaceae bacterium]|jgi:hypothetical protein
MRKGTRVGMAAITAIAFISWIFLFSAGSAMAASKPTVKSYSAYVQDDYVLLEGYVDFDGDDYITEYGFYYGSDENRMSKKRVGYEIREGVDFELELDMYDLDSNTTYYFQAYAKNRAGLIGYSTTREFTTSRSGGRGLPEVSTDSARVGYDYATLYGSIDDDGGYDITEYGFYYGTSQSAVTKKLRVGYDIDEGDDFDYELEDIDEDTRYYYKAYAKNSRGTAYGSVKSFTTDEYGSSGRYSDRPEVTTKTPKLGYNYAIFYGIVDDTGDSSIREYGFYWGTDKDTRNKVEVGSRIEVDRTFSYELDNLEAGKTYYVKAYARNSSGTSYGDTIRVGSATSGTLPTLGVKVNDIRAGGATLQGVVEKSGGTITEYGFYYSPSGGTERQVRFFGSIGVNMPYQYILGGLTSGTYSVKSYAISSAGVAFSTPITFNTSGTVTPAPAPVTPAPGVIGQAPVVLISSPVAGMVITRGQTVEIAATSTDDVLVEAMGLYINGVKKMRCGGANFQYFWNTGEVLPGVYKIRVTSWDGALAGERNITVTVK